MEAIAKRAAALQDISMDMWRRGRKRMYVRGRRPAIPTTPTSTHPYQSPCYVFSSPGASSIQVPSSSGLTSSPKPRSPRGFVYGGFPFTERPIAPSRLGVIYRAPMRSPGGEPGDRSLSPFYTPGILSPRGYTEIEMDSEDRLEGDSVQGAEVEGDPLEQVIAARGRYEAEIGASQEDGAAVIGSQTRSIASVVGFSSSSVEIELEVSMRGTPVEEAIMLSSQREFKEAAAAEGVGD